MVLVLAIQYVLLSYCTWYWYLQCSTNMFYCRVIVHGIGTCNVQQYVLSYCTCIGTCNTNLFY